MATDITIDPHQSVSERSQPSARRAASALDRRRIVVGVDDSDAAAAAVNWAATEALARGVGLHVLHAWDSQSQEPWSHAIDSIVVPDLTRRGRAIVTRFEEQARSFSGLAVTGESCRGHAADVLAALGEHAGLIVVGTHHLGPLGRVVLGSVSTAIVARAPCPVVVFAGPAGSSDRPRNSPAVVVGVTGIEDDTRVLEFAFAFASRHNRPLHALYYWHPPLADATVPPPECAQAWLSESLAGWREQFPDVPVLAAVVRDHPVSGLVNAAAAQELLVVGRHSDRLRLGARLGSVCLGVLHQATCPVAVVPPALPSAS